MFRTIWFLIDRDDWWLKLAEILVRFQDSTILNPPTNCIFQSKMLVTIFGAYFESVAEVPVPLHGCWVNETHLDAIWNSIGTAFEYAF